MLEVMKHQGQARAESHSALEALAVRAGLAPEGVRQAGCDPKGSEVKALESSSRCGGLRGDSRLWAATRHLQCYLDSLAAPKRLMPAVSQSQWEAISAGILGDGGWEEAPAGGSARAD